MCNHVEFKPYVHIIDVKIHSVNKVNKKNLEQLMFLAREPKCPISTSTAQSDQPTRRTMRTAVTTKHNAPRQGDS